MVTPTLTDEQIASYRKNGFTKIPKVLTPEEVSTFHAAALDATTKVPRLSDRPIFDQFVNVWTSHKGMRALTFHPALAAIAKQLAGVPLRLWHDQILIKQPHNNTPTSLHQDQPFWPHAESDNTLTAWIALVDVPVERGCMTYIPGVQSRRDLPAQSLDTDEAFFRLAPEMAWEPRVTIPMQAGDVAFHHNRAPHRAGANDTDEPRIAFIVNFMDAGTKYDGKAHVTTDPLGLKVGDTLEGELFPMV